MTRPRLLAALVAALVPATAAAFWLSDPEWAIQGVDAEEVEDRSRALALARKSCRLEDLDAFVAQQRERAEAAVDDPVEWFVLGEAYHERAVMRDHRSGLKPGRQLHDELPPALARDIELGHAALDRSLELGYETSESWRLKTALLCAEITGLKSVLRIQAEATAALDRAYELDPKAPRVHMTIGCRKLFAPRMLGQDVEKALEHLLLAVEGCPLDERPCIFAALASHLSGDDARALELLDEARTRTPANAYAKEVRRRLAAGEEDPFERDV